MPQIKTAQEVSNYASVLTHCLDLLNVQQRLSGNAGHSLEMYHSFLQEKKTTEATTQLLLVTPLYTWKLGNSVWELGNVWDFTASFVWLSCLYMDRHLPTF